MNKKLVAKQLIKIARQIVSSSWQLYYIVDKNVPNDHLGFFVGIQSKIDDRTFSSISRKVSEMQNVLNTKFRAMKNEFKKSDFIKSVEGPEVSEYAFTIEKDYTIDGMTTLYLKVDYDENGTEYTLDSTINILKKYGFKNRR